MLTYKILVLVFDKRNRKGEGDGDYLSI